MTNKYKHIIALPVKELSGFNPKPGKIFPPKKHQYFIQEGLSITGDSPKDFIKLYNYGYGRKINHKTWQLYIAKLGHKHYPIESIIEFLLHRIGEEYGFKMAGSQLAWLGGQIRFLSLYFINKPNQQVLNHGADLYAGYLNDKEFVEEVEKQKKSPDFFTVEFTYEVIKYFFPKNSKEIIEDFSKMIIYDTLIGNNDRHFYNWGVIKNLLGKEEPYFSPIYDTARALFWNVHEDKVLETLKNNNTLDSYIERYCENSKPKIGWEGKVKINHFDLIELMKTEPIGLNCENMLSVCSDEILNKVFKMIDNEFDGLLSKPRIVLIKKCLLYRHNRIKRIFY